MHLVFLTHGRWGDLDLLFELWQRIPYTRRGENIIGTKYAYVRFREVKLHFKISGLDVYLMEAIFPREIKDVFLCDVNSFNPRFQQSYKTHRTLKIGLFMVLLKLCGLMLGMKPVSAACVSDRFNLKGELWTKGWVSHWGWILPLGVIEDKTREDGIELT